MGLAVLDQLRRRVPPAAPPMYGEDDPSGISSAQPLTDADVYQPAGPPATATQDGQPAAPAGTGSPFDPAPYMQRIHDTEGALQSKLDELGQMNYTPPQHGKGYRLAEGLVSMFSPGLSNALFERNEQRGYEGYRTNLETQGRQVSALQNAAQDAIREMGTAQTGDFYKRRGAYYDQLSTASQDKQETLQNQYSAAVQKAISEHRDPQSDPLVKQLSDAITSLQRPAAEPAETPYRDWRKMHPNADPIEWQRAQAQVKDDFHHDPAPKKATPGQSLNIEAKKQSALQKAEGRFKQGLMSQEELQDAKQQIQNAYEAEIQAVGGDAQHFEYPGPDGQGGAPAEPQVAAPGAAPAAAGQGPLTAAEAKTYLAKAGGDKNKARQMARADGRTF